MNPRPLTAKEEEEIHTLQRYVIAAHGSHPAKGATAAHSEIPLYALPDQPYLERAVMPLLLRGLEELALARPPDPLAFLGAYLLSNNPQRRGNQGDPSSGNADSSKADPAGTTVAKATVAEGKGKEDPAAAGGDRTEEPPTSEAAAAADAATARKLFHGVADRTEVAAIAAEQFEPES